MTMHPPIHHDSYRDPTSSPTAVTLGDGTEFFPEDWWDRLGDGPWRDEASVNAVCGRYAERVERLGLPDDQEVLYGNLTEPDGRQRAALVHESELS